MRLTDPKMIEKMIDPKLGMAKRDSDGSTFLKKYHALIKNDPRSAPKLNIILGIKQENKGKIESHFWFFRGIVETVSPEFV